MSFLDKLRGLCEETSETPESTDLHLTRDAFQQKMLVEEDGQALLDLLSSGEYKVCERMGLSNGYIEDGVAYIDVPRWNNLVAHLRIVNSI